jgi:hypothetical protein
VAEISLRAVVERAIEISPFGRDDKGFGRDDKGFG